MAEDVLLTCLPAEVIELILENKNLTIEDAINVSKSCKLLNRIITNSNKLWKVKFFQRWPLLKEAYIDHEKNGKVQNWYNETKTNVTSRKALMSQLSLMSAKYYKKQELSHSEFKDYDPLFQESCGAHPMGYHFIVDELINIINQCTLECNLTIRYYAFKVVRYVKQCYLTKVWQDYIELPPSKQLLEIGATIVAQWSQPERHVTYGEICKKLDDIVQQGKDFLKEQYPKHPIFSIPQETLNHWKCNNIEDNQFPLVETTQIMVAMCEVMFKKLGFHGTSEMYYFSENSFIDRVLELKQGIPITLAIVFESICRRVGVKCEPINFPAHFLLRWKEKYTGLSDEDMENFYIDVFNGGRFLTQQNCPRLGGVSKCPIERYNIQNASSAKEVVERMANNLEVASRQRTRLNGRAARLRSALELLHMVRPHDTGAILHLARFYMLYQMDLAKLVEILTYIKRDPEFTSRGPANHILQMLQDYEKHMNVVTEEAVVVKKRMPDVKYAVGMIMKHQKYHYMCVITGWDMKCEASQEWMQEMGVDELRSGANQPFYNVFVEGGSSRYAAQENLQMAENPGWINHYETGRYFSQFKVTHYVPNEEKAKEYPEDGDIREQLLSKYM